MKNIILWLVLVILMSSCSNINIISHKNNVKPNPCYYDKDNGTIKPYDSDKYRVTEKYLWEH
jgi:uncharacterized protein YceK